jgi:hypothetical protein
MRVGAKIMGSKVKAFMSWGSILTSEPTRFFGDAATAASFAEREARAILAESERPCATPLAVYTFHTRRPDVSAARAALAESLAAFVGMSL